MATMGDLRARIAQALNWSIKDTQSLSFPSLRDFVRNCNHPELAAEMDQVIAHGHHLLDRGDNHDFTKVPMPDMSWLGPPPPLSGKKVTK